jgi:transcriptional regulator with XRE-family HTH domain
MNRPDIVDMLVERRKALGMSQRDLAELMGRHQATVCGLELGYGGPGHLPSEKILRRWAWALGLDVDIQIRFTERSGA